MGRPAMWIHAALLFMLVVAFPIWDRYETRRLKRENSEAARIRAYRITIGWLWIATALLIATMPLRDLTSPVRRLPFSAKPEFIIPVVIGLVIALFLPVVSASGRKRLAEQMKSYAFILPRTDREKRYWLLVAISAGICEEVIFRGWLIQYLSTFVVFAGAVVAAAIIFAIDHSYQGWAGLVSTFFFALVMTLLFYASSMLIVAIVVHALFDLRVLVAK